MDIELKLYATPPKFKKMFEDTKREIVILAGRGVGKTASCITPMCIEDCINYKRNVLLFWPSARQRNAWFERFETWLSVTGLFEKVKGDIQSLRCYNGSILTFSDTSARSLGKLRGERYQRLYIDESQDAFRTNAEIRHFKTVTTGLFTQGGAIRYFGTMKSENSWWVNKVREVDLDPTNISLYRYTYRDVDHIDLCYIEAERNANDPKTVSEEFECIPYGNTSLLFGRALGHSTLQPITLEDTQRSIVGLDVGGKDYWALSSFYKKQEVDLLYWTGYKIDTAKTYILEFCKKTNAKSLIVEDTQAARFALSSFEPTLWANSNTSLHYVVMTQKLKADMVVNLSHELHTEGNKLRFQYRLDHEPNIQMESFGEVTKDVTKSGLKSYKGLHGQHDDIVMARLMAYNGYNHSDTIFPRSSKSLQVSNFYKATARSL